MFEGIGTLMEESFDSNLDSDFRVALKKLYKKDLLTKIKVNIKKYQYDFSKLIFN